MLRLNLLIKPLMKAVRAATVEGKCWKQELHKFLRQYRATPHPSTGFSPYHLMFGRASQTRLPQVTPPTKETEIEHEARRNDNLAKTNMKRYADARKHATPCDLKVGDTRMRKDGISWLHFTVSSHISSLRRMEA
jgi:hypothetical protein